MRGVAVLRPEPGATATADRAARMGLAVLRLPLFELRPLPWIPPDPRGFDALLLTSAAAPRLAGPGLVALRGLPVVAVGPATADVARAAGLAVAGVGDADAAAAVALARARGLPRLLHLAGRERASDLPGVRPLAVYGADESELTPGATTILAEGWTALLHSPRAARRLAELVDRDATSRGLVGLAAISPAALAAAGGGWAAARAAPRPDDAALLALAAG